MSPTTVEDLGGPGLPALLQLLNLVPMMTGEGVGSQAASSCWEVSHPSWAISCVGCFLQGSAGTLLVDWLEL